MDFNLYSITLEVILITTVKRRWLKEWMNTLAEYYLMWPLILKGLKWFFPFKGKYILRARRRKINNRWPLSKPNFIVSILKTLTKIIWLLAGREAIETQLAVKIKGHHLYSVTTDWVTTFWVWRSSLTAWEAAVSKFSHSLEKSSL